MTILNKKNFVLYAAQHYDNIACHSTKEFYDDLGRLSQLSRMLTKFRKGDQLKTRMILNHFIVFFNVFSTDAAIKLVWFKLSDFADIIKPFMLMLGYLPDTISINDTIINTTTIPMNDIVVSELRKL